ncbi:hypothetical protein E2320_005086 [Naja naja]|nr:hypothetical protein E2320_005086 [Naja naja]
MPSRRISPGVPPPSHTSQYKCDRWLLAPAQYCLNGSCEAQSRQKDARLRIFDKRAPASKCLSVRVVICPEKIVFLFLLFLYTSLTQDMTEVRVEAKHLPTEGGAWLLVLSSVLLCNLLKILLPSCSSIVSISRLLQKDAEQESEMRSDIQSMKQELSTISMMDEFARYARLERKINKMTDKLKTHVKTRTAQLAKIKWVINIVFYILQGALMISLIWKYYSEPVTVLPSKWLAPLEHLVAFPTGVAGKAIACKILPALLYESNNHTFLSFLGGVGITCWLVVCNKVVAIMLHPFS